jgi:ribosomal protein L22
MARDAGTKIDQPSDQEGGKATDAEAKQAAKEAAEAKKAEKAAAPKPKAKRKPAAKKAEGTAAAVTGVEKEAAEAALEGAEAAKPKPKRARKPAAKKKAAAAATDDAPAADAAATDDVPTADAATEEAAPAKKPRTRRKPAAKEEGDAKAAAPEPPKPAKSARAARRRRREAAEPLVTVRATARFVRSSPRKARLITDHIKGKTVDEARAILAFSPRSVAHDWRKLLESAIANAENNHDLVGDDLRILNATADDGPTLKRFRPRAMGRATRIRKRTSHLTITLTPKE